MTHQYCDCPYDLGPVCKHVTAALFYLQQDTLDISVKSKSGKAKPVKARKTLDDKVDDVLKELPKRSLPLI